MNDTTMTTPQSRRDAGETIKAMAEQLGVNNLSAAWIGDRFEIVGDLMIVATAETLDEAFIRAEEKLKEWEE